MLIIFLQKATDDVTGFICLAAWSHSDDGGNPKSEFLQLILVFDLEST